MRVELNPYAHPCCLPHQEGRGQGPLGEGVHGLEEPGVAGRTDQEGHHGKVGPVAVVQQEESPTPLAKVCAEGIVSFNCGHH